MHHVQGPRSVKSGFIDPSSPSGHLLLLIESVSCFWQAFFFCGAPFGKAYCFLKGCNFSFNSRKEQEKKQLPQGRLLCPLQPVRSCSHNSLQATTGELVCVCWRRCSPIRIIFSCRNAEHVTLLLINCFGSSGSFPAQYQRVQRFRQGRISDEAFSPL